MNDNSPRYHDKARWFQVFNTTPWTIPGYAVMKYGIHGESLFEVDPYVLNENHQAISVMRPDDDSQANQDWTLHCINSPIPIPPAKLGGGGYGWATIDFPARVLHGKYDRTFCGDVSGIVSGSWILSYAFDAYRSLGHAPGSPFDTDEDCIWVVPNPVQFPARAAGRISQLNGASAGAVLSSGATPTPLPWLFTTAGPNTPITYGTLTPVYGIGFAADPVGSVMPLKILRSGDYVLHFDAVVWGTTNPGDNPDEGADIKLGWWRNGQALGEDWSTFRRMSAGSTTIEVTGGCGISATGNTIVDSRENIACTQWMRLEKDDELFLAISVTGGSGLTNIFLRNGHVWIEKRGINPNHSQLHAHSH